MIRFLATYYDGVSSRPRPVEVFVEGQTLTVVDDKDSNYISLSLKSCSVEPRLANIVRSILLPDGGLLETDDFTAVDSIEKVIGRTMVSRAVYFLESYWKTVIGCFICLVVFVVVTIKFVLPFAATRAANSLSPDVMETVTKEALKVLDARYVAPTNLPVDRIDRETARFRTITNDIDPGGTYRIEFRRGKRIGPNALALPSGVIVVTDELINLAQSDEELTGIFAHEVIHVQKRHAIRHAFQSTGVFLLIAALTGDITSVTSVSAAIPTLLVESGYSRDFEREADRGAGMYLIGKGIGTKPFRDILARLTKNAPDTPGFSFISTHPGTQERLQYLEDLEKGQVGGKK